MRLNLWNRATIGVVSISNSRDYLDGLMKNVERAATRIANNHGADVADSFVEYFEAVVGQSRQGRSKQGNVLVALANSTTTRP